MIKIVKGNTIYVNWHILKNASKEIADPSVILIDTFRKKQTIDSSFVVNNESIDISVIYEGSNQKSVGKYALTFINNAGEDNQNTLVYKDAFALVHSLNNRICCYGDDVIDDAAVLDLSTDLTVSLFDTSTLNSYISTVQNLDDTISELEDSIEENADTIDDLSTYIHEVVDVSVNNLYDEIEQNEKTLVEYFKILDTSIKTLNSSVNTLEG